MRLGQLLEFHRGLQVDPDTGCKVWPRSPGAGGYPYIWYNGTNRRGNRLFLEIKLGRSINPGMHALHTCHNRMCVAFDHLYEGTHQDNMNDRMAAGRYQFGEDHPSRKHPERWKRGDEHYSRLHPELRVKGEKHGCAKLNEEKVRQIRELFRQGIPTREIAPKFGVGKGTINSIVYGPRWSHVR